MTLESSSPHGGAARPAVDEIHLVPLGDCPRPLARVLAERLSRRSSVPCRLSPNLPLPEPARLAGRGQLDAHALVQHLAGAPAGGEVRLGVTTHDLGLSVFSFVFGLAHTGDGRAAVVSTARLDPAFYGLPADPETTLRRALSTMLHELGHVAGLPHCPAPDCLMRFAGTVEKADARGEAFCQACHVRLPHWLRPAHVAACLS